MALDPVSQLIWDEAAPVEGTVLVVDDVFGELTAEVAEAGLPVRAWCDDLRDAQAISPALRLPSHGAAWDADLVLWRLPKSRAALEDTAEWLAGRLKPTARIVAGGRTKHMTPTQTDLLRRQFSEVSASRGRQKSRVLRASGPIPQPHRWPQRRFVPDAGLMVVAHGAVFNTNRLDDGTHLLLRTLARVMGEPGGHEVRGAALDLGCGSGILATWLAQRGWVTTGSDVSWAAVSSTALTAAANDVEVTVHQADGLRGVSPASFDLIVTNPPFHRGSAKDSTPTMEMIADAGQVLREAGEFWTVFNAHLPYLPLVRRHIGTTTIEARDRHYIVTRSIKDPLP